MNGNSLNTTTGSGTQQSTGTPQGGATANPNNASTGPLQSTNTATYLDGHSSSALQLTPTALSTVNLNAATTSTPTTEATSKSTTHHLNAGLLSIAVVLFLVAVALFWMTSRSAHKETE